MKACGGVGGGVGQLGRQDDLEADEEVAVALALEPRQSAASQPEGAAGLSASWDRQQDATLR